MGGQDWFDPWLDSDTRLFVDPFLVFEDPSSFWQEAHADLVAFFNQAMLFIAEARSEHHPSWIRARGMLQFPEPDEFCLGFGGSTTLGAGSGRGLAALIMGAARGAIDRGVDHVDHFEELALFGEGFGADRISDIVCNVIKSHFITYTQGVCETSGVPTEPVPVRNAAWSRSSFRWRHATCDLPANPHSRHAVLLVPSRFLRVLPSLDAAEFWEFMWSNDNEQLRNDFGDELRRHLNRSEIIAYARRRRSFVERFVRHQHQAGTTGYDVERDPDFRIRLREGADAISQSAAPPPFDPSQLCAFVSALVHNFKHCVEQRGAWNLLWVGDQPRKEDQAQRLFDTSAVAICRDRDVDLTREAGTGFGPVDFKLSTGWRGRAHVELKLAGSTSIRRNLRNQLATYMASDDSQCGYYVVIQQHDRDCRSEFVESLAEIAAEGSAALSKPHELIFVDARPRASASNI